MNDEDFKLTLKMVACELDITKYLNPRRAALMFLIKKITIQKTWELAKAVA